MCNSIHTLEPHICRVCQGRIVSSAGEGKERVYTCSNCGLVASGDTAAVVCCCGLKFSKGRRKGGTSIEIDAGVRCTKNTAVSPEFPGLYVAEYVEGKGEVCRSPDY